MMLASFIIPAHNASSTIIGCLDSIYGLAFRDIDFEVIVVDDCSTDNTVEIVEKYAISYSNLVLFRQSENHRQGSARNIGIAIAKGNLVVFVDSDDEVDSGVVSVLRMTDELGLDMVSMKSTKVSASGDIEEVTSLPYSSSTIFTGIELQKDHPFWFTGVVSYVFRLDFIKRVCYPFAEDVLYEDSDFLYMHLFHAKRMSYCDECGYKVLFNSISVTHTISYRHLSDYALLGTRMLRLCESFLEKSKEYAESMAAGGSYNLNKAFKMLYLLDGKKEIASFYDRFDAACDRILLVGHKEPSLKLTLWTTFCLKHRNVTILLLGLASPVLKFIRKHRIKM
ncbi:MAG: glycosyltransferase family 2 protein [Alphaproteobacteria bacterium]|jgi:glycosyltransferase involved in cell wall biosynthesis|nr:glycosyltransferase family 2 protein [Alphaproteobacteria bacterium]